MRFSFDDEQMQLRQAARRFLEQNSDSAQVRAAMDSTSGYDADIWSRVVEDLGWAALTIARPSSMVEEDGF